MTAEDDLKSLDGRPVPAWYDDAKLGIFIHWGMWTIPAFAPREGHLPDLMKSHYKDLNKHIPYTEWYWNAIKLDGSASAEYHRKTFGNKPYDAFREMFEAEAEAFDADAWADLFVAAGARYVVFVTKHHDGYCLWPTQHPNPLKPDWNSPRDYVGELAKAVRARGLHFGVYYSGGLDWTFNPMPIANFGDMLASQVMSDGYADYADLHLRELIERYDPAVLWNDIGHPRETDIFPLFTDYYAAVPDGVVNDRWHPPGAFHKSMLDEGARAAFNDMAAKAAAAAPPKVIPPLPPHCDFRTPEFSAFEDIEPKKWEATRGLGSGFGFNRFETAADMMSPDELVCSFIDMVAKNGNFLVNVGPEASGAIPTMQADLLKTLGEWLNVNGRAIYGTRPWIRAGGMTGEGLPVRYTQKDGKVFALVLGRPDGAVTFVDPPPGAPSVLMPQGEIFESTVEARDNGVQVVLDRPWPDTPAIGFEFFLEY